ncbi:RNA polymerase sigma factor [Nesterenkonia rhizosphaerae]|uniref:RNA polymerase sigma factor n=1 Tax=Nesterenkonia rhizosphaerae TaxID=1348272 RepID=A0ABP9G7R7_9MICC
MTETSQDTVRSALESISVEGRSRILASLARRFSDLDLAEEMLQEAMVQALRTWGRDGVPVVPEAWLTTVAARRGMDMLRQDQARARMIPRLGVLQEREPAAATELDPAQVLDDEPAVTDERLGLFFACAHPLLKPEEQVALTLRFLAGLSTAEVAHGLLVPVATMQQRIVRAKRRIRSLGISFEIPTRQMLPERLGAVQRVVYLLFAEGFARSAGGSHIQDDLTEEAVRLARLLRALMPGSAEATGLLGLLLLTQARRPARTDTTGRPVPLADQDRSLWDLKLLSEGLELAERAARAPGAGRYAIQAAIAAVHAEAADLSSTDWPQIVVLYRMLESYEPTPVVWLGRAVAIGRARGLDEGLSSWRCWQQIQHFRGSVPITWPGL